MRGAEALLLARGPDVVDDGLLYTHFHEDFDADAEHARGQSIAADNFGEIFAVERHGCLGERQSDEKAHADLVASFAGLEKNPAARNAEGSAHVLEMVLLRIRRTDAHKLRDFAAPTAAALRGFGCRCGRASAAGCLAHDTLLGLHECLASSLWDASGKSVRLAQHKTYS